MSHFSQIKTQIRNLSALQAALNDLEIDWKPGPSEVRGYRGQTRAADLAIAQSNGYDIGFCWNGNEYELVADLQYWNQPTPVDHFLSKVTQRYAFQTVLTESVQRGFQLAEQQQNADGSLRLVLQRWSA